MDIFSINGKCLQFVLPSFRTTLAKLVTPTSATSYFFSQMSGAEVLSLNFVKAMMIHLKEVCHVLLILLSFMYISGNSQYY